MTTPNLRGPLSPASASPLRHTICRDELLILAQVAAAGNAGYLLERGQESRLHQILVEDGYLTHKVLSGVSRSYGRFALTDAGRNALALKTPDALVYNGSDDQQAIEFLDADNTYRDPGGHVFVPDPKTGSRCMFCRRVP